MIAPDWEEVADAADHRLAGLLATPPVVATV
jgi:hypothetical protein